MSTTHDIIKNWINKGDHDLGTAQVTFKHSPQFLDTIAFHCQQAVEKYLKGYLVFLDIPFSKSHDLNYLLSLISQKDSIGADLYEKAAELDDFSVEIRYPDSVIELSEDDIERALAISEEFRKFVISKMNIKTDYKEIL